MNMSSHLPSRSLGFNLLEVLVALVVVMIGLLGIVGLQARAHTSELESYQRAQALVMLYDMVDRINNNRLTAPCFAITTDTTNGTPYLGTVAGGGHLSTPTSLCGVSTTQNNALANNSINAWDALLRGASETKGGAEVGAMIGARGCVSYNTGSEYVDAATGLNIGGTGEYTISVAWQGMADTFAPTVSCGKNLYATETKRRTVWVTTRLGTLIAR